LTAQPHAYVRFERAIERRALWLAEDAARELPKLSLPDALQLVHLYRERGSPKFEPGCEAVARSLSDRRNAEPDGRRQGHGEAGKAPLVRLWVERREVVSGHELLRWEAGASTDFGRSHTDQGARARLCGGLPATSQCAVAPSEQYPDHDQPQRQ
jgi:hypothetical protein